MATVQRSTGSALPGGSPGSITCARCDCAVSASQSASRKPLGAGGGSSIASIAGSRNAAAHRAKRPSDAAVTATAKRAPRSEEHTSELQSPCKLVCRLLLEKKKKKPSHLSSLKKKQKSTT